MTRKEIQHQSAKVDAVPKGFAVDDAVGDYLNTIHQIPLLTREEEWQLAICIEEGRDARQKLAKPDGRRAPTTIAKLRQQSDAGFAAKDEIVYRNLRLVPPVAHTYQGRGVLFLDLIQEGNIGLMRAALRYDVHRGHRFSTYATWWIRQALTRAVADQGRTVRIPIHAVDRIRKIKGVETRLTQELGRKPTGEEIAVEFPDLTIKQITFYLDKSRAIYSLEHSTGEDNQELGESLSEDPALSPAAQTTRTLLKKHVVSALEYLSPREACILKLRHGLDDGGPGLTREQTGEKMGISQKYVRRLEANALSHLRHNPAVLWMLRDYFNKEEDR